MKISFENPNKLSSTGVIFLKSLIGNEFGNESNISKASIIKRFFTKFTSSVVVFCPLTPLCIFSKKDDVILLPDDSLRSTLSVAKVRMANKQYFKAFYQLMRFLLIYILLRYLKNRKLLTVSKEDESSLKLLFPRHDVRYISHPIQMRVLNEVPNPRPPKGVNKILFLNLQEFYTVSPNEFILLPRGSFNKDLHLGFHGSDSLRWYNSAKISGYNNLNVYGFVDSLSVLMKSYDAVVMPLKGGAGIKNIMLNSIYLNIFVFGTKEAFSGVPDYLRTPFIITDMSQIESKVIDFKTLEEDFLRLREYILAEHELCNFTFGINNL